MPAHDDQSNPASTPAVPPPPVSQRPASVLLPSGHEPASWAARVEALLIDLLIVSPALAIIAAAVATINDPSANGIRTVSSVAVLLVVLYPSLTMARTGPRNGQTLGKQLVGIRVVRDARAPYKVGAAMLREVLLKLFVFNPLYLVTLVNYLWPLWDRQHRALHDLVAQSHVVKA